MKRFLFFLISASVVFAFFNSFYWGWYDKS